MVSGALHIEWIYDGQGAKGLEVAYIINKFFFKDDADTVRNRIRLTHSRFYSNSISHLIFQ
jgi:hypothetical protein